MSITLSSILHTGSSVSGTGTPLLSDSPVVTSKIDTTSTSFDLVNTTATTVNIAGAATSLSLAGNSGTTTIRNNLSVSGNITYGGGANQLSATNLSVDDALIYLAANNVADILDIGLVGAYELESAHLHTGLVRDASDAVWKLFSGIVSEPTTVVDFTSAAYDNLKIGGLIASTGSFSSTISGTQITSTVATGTAPFVVTSATPVTGLNIGGYATKLKSSTGEVTVSSTTPSTGQVLMATGTSEATWQTISTGGTGTVTSVGGTGTVNGITLSGTVDTANPSGNLTLSGTLSGVDLASAVTGILPVTHGGTGSTSTAYCSLTTNVSGILPVTHGGTGSSSLTFPSGTADIGYLNIPQISQSSNYTCVLSDAGKHILHPSEDTTGRTFTIPANASVAYAIGTVLVFVNEHGAGPVTIAMDTDNLYLAGDGTTGTRTLAADGIATAIKTSTTNWLISGTNLS